MDFPLFFACRESLFLKSSANAMQGGYSTRFFLILVPVLFIRVFATRLLLKPQNALFRAAKHY